MPHPLTGQIVWFVSLLSQHFRESVRSIIMHRIGVDKYTTKLDRIRKSKEFILAEHDTVSTFYE